MRLVFICSPYSGDIAYNVEVARSLCRMALLRECAPFAPHLLYPQMLDDDAPNEREAGIRAGLEFMAVCDEVWAFTRNGVSSGMRREIEHAHKLGLRVVVVEQLSEGV